MARSIATATLVLAMLLVSTGADYAEVPLHVRRGRDDLADSIVAARETTLTKPNIFSFAAMDLIYLQRYLDWTGKALKKCRPYSNGGTVVTAAKLANKIKFDKQAAMAYKKLFTSVQYNTEPTEALRQYKIFYQRKRTCTEVLSAMMPCLCSYGTLAERLRGLDIARMKKKERKLINAFISYNGGGSGSSCRYAASLLEANGELEHGIVNQGFQHEKALWSVPDDVVVEE